MRDIWSFLLQTFTASGVAVLLLVVKAMFQDKLSPRWQFAAWAVLGVILLRPAGWGGRYPLLNWLFIVELLRSALTGEYGALAKVTAPVPLPPEAPPGTVEDWLFAIYAAGVVFFVVRYMVSYIRLRLALRRGCPVEGSRVRTVAERYGLSACPAVEVEGLPSAFICGVFKPVLALPAGVETDEKVLLHELLHLKYQDAAWGLLICFFRCLHWCNPLLWYCASRAGNDLEALCDQRVLERLEGEDRRDYGRILLSMADEKYAQAPGTSSMANGGKNIRRRIEAIARFKRYPAGMGLVSVCVLLVLTAPLAVGTKATLVQEPLLELFNSPAYARTVPCTTYAGAFDTYAKAVLNQSLFNRAMCAPLSEQNRLAEAYWTDSVWGCEEIGLQDGNSILAKSSGYQLYNLTRVDKDVYEGLLALILNGPPEGEEWDSTKRSRWMAVQTVRAEKEGERWVIIPQGEFQKVQGDFTVHENRALPCVTYEAQWEDFSLQLRYQTSSYVNSYVQSGNFFPVSTIDLTPQPDGEFLNEYYEELVVFHTGDPADRARYTSMSVDCAAMWAKEPKPVPAGTGGVYVPAGMERPDGVDTSYHSSGRTFGGHKYLEDQDWEDGIYLTGGGGYGDIDLDLADGYLANFNVTGPEGGTSAELVLLPVERGTSLD